MSIPELPLRLTPRHNMLICSSAYGGKHTELMKIMAPTAAYYAARHRMDHLLLPLKERLAPERPPAWDKIVLIRRALDQYDTVMWLDADAIFCDPSRDIRSALVPGIPVHLVAHRIGRRVIPNTGMLVLRKGETVFRLLRDMWNQHPYINHRWWEQAAFMHLIGYDPDQVIFKGKTSYTDQVHFLGNEWNSRDKDCAEKPFIYHFCNKDKPVEGMLQKREQFVSSILGLGGM